MEDNENGSCVDKVYGGRFHAVFPNHIPHDRPDHHDVSIYCQPAAQCSDSARRLHITIFGLTTPFLPSRHGCIQRITLHR